MENPKRTAEHRARVDERHRQLREYAQLELPSEQLFTLEIGCGHGHFLNAYAAAHPSEICLGLDLIRERVARANRKKNRARLLNLKFLQAGAEDFLTVIPSTLRFGKIFVLFPDPWPKRRHHKNRLIQPAFLDLLRRFSTPGTRLYFRTDDEAYLQAAAAMVESSTQWNLVNEPWPFEHQTVFQERADRYQSFIAGPARS